MRAAWLCVALLLGVSPVRSQEPLKDLARLQKETNAGRLEVLREILQERGIPFEAQTFSSETKEGAQAGTNLVVAFGQGSKEIIVGAHYDAVRLKDGALSRGMVDNGASVIALVRLAEGLKGKTLAHRVRIVFFDQEEIGLRGSKAFVASLQPGAVAAAVNLDIAGYGTSLVFGAGPEARDAPVYQAVRQVCAARGLACAGFPKFPVGDDRSFAAAGIPNVSLGFLPEVEAHQLWLLLNGGPSSGLADKFVPEILKIIHTAEDTLGKVEPATLDLASGVLLDVVLGLDAQLK